MIRKVQDNMETYLGKVAIYIEDELKNTFKETIKTNCKELILSAKAETLLHDRTDDLEGYGTIKIPHDGILKVVGIKWSNGYVRTSHNIGEADIDFELLLSTKNLRTQMVEIKGIIKVIVKLYRCIINLKLGNIIFCILLLLDKIL
jgi:hypothetical protein